MPRLSETPYLHDDAVVVGSTLGHYVEIGVGARVTESIFGDYSYTDRYAEVAYSTLGKFVNVAAFVRINPGEHPYERASLHHFMYRSEYYWPEEKDEEAVFDRRRSRGVVVGHDTWLGHGSLIMKGVTVGDGAIIGALSVVTKDVPPYAIVAGTPAKFIKWRHPEAIGQRLQALAWWDWKHETLRRALKDFRSLPVEAFLERYEERNAALAAISR